MSFFEALWLEARAANTLWLLAMCAVALLTRRAVPHPHRLRVLSFWVVGHLVALAVDAALRAREHSAGNEFRTVAWVFGAVAFVGASMSVLFHGLLPKARVSLPRIVEDGFKTAGNWYTIPEEARWHTVSWRIEDPCFVNYWGYNFVLESDGPKFSNYYIRSVSVSKLAE